MKCKSCGSNRVLVESTGNGGSKRTCQECGHNEVVNREGQRLLTDDQRVPSDQRRVLTEG